MIMENNDSNYIQNIVNGYANGKMTYMNASGLHEIDIDDIFKHDASYILELLNRNPEIVLKVAYAAPEKKKWVNDYAIGNVVIKLFEYINDLINEVITKDSEIERLKNENIASQVKLEKANVDYVSKEEVEKIYDEIRDLNTQITDLTKKNNDLSIERDELTTTLNEQEAQIDDYKKLNEKYGTTILELTKTKEELEHALNVSNDDINNLKQMVDDLEHTVNITNDDNNDLKQIVESLQKERNDLLEKQTELFNKCVEYDKHNNIYKETIDNFIKQVNEIKINNQHSNKTTQEKMGDNLTVDFNMF